ncbi:hypothetical protein ACWD6I_15450 [Streptomyces sp. NPDC002454]
MTTLAHLRKAALALPGTAERATRTAAASFLLAVTATAALGWTAVSHWWRCSGAPTREGSQRKHEEKEDGCGRGTTR